MVGSVLYIGPLLCQRFPNRESRLKFLHWEVPALGKNFPFGRLGVAMGSCLPYYLPMPTIEYIIERMGGGEAAPRLTGVGTEAVRNWRQSRAIPSRHWPAVIAATGLAMADLQP